MGECQTIADVEARIASWLERGNPTGGMNLPSHDGKRPSIRSDLTALLASHRKMREENEDLRSSVVAFCAPWAVTYARDHGLPDGHLFANHYDILERAGARMVDFTRHVEGDADAPR